MAQSKEFLRKLRKKHGLGEFSARSTKKKRKRVTKSRKIPVSVEWGW